MNKKALDIMYDKLSLIELKNEYIRAQELQDFEAMADISVFIKKKQEELKHSPF